MTPSVFNSNLRNFHNHRYLISYNCTYLDLIVNTLLPSLLVCFGNLLYPVHLGALLLLTGEYDQAKDCFEEALAIRTELFTVSDVSVAQVLCNIGE